MPGGDGTPGEPAGGLTVPSEESGAEVHWTRETPSKGVYRAGLKLTAYPRQLRRHVGSKLRPVALNR
jgi:hypothetical protein